MSADRTSKSPYEILGISHFTAIWVTVIIVGIYTVSGGLAAVVMTDVMQLVVMFVGTGALVILGLWEAGGWTGMSDTILAQPDATEEYFRLLGPHKEGAEYPWPGMVFSLGIVMSTAYFVGNQAVMRQRGFEADMRRPVQHGGYDKRMRLGSPVGRRQHEQPSLQTQDLAGAACPMYQQGARAIAAVWKQVADDRLVE